MTISILSCEEEVKGPKSERFPASFDPHYFFYRY